MHRIRIPKEHWGQVWRTLVAIGPLSRVSTQLDYVISERQLRVLKKKKLPFEMLGPANGHAGPRHG
jgi:hypothetical protein